MFEYFVDVADQVEKDDCAPGRPFFGPFTLCISELEIWGTICMSVEERIRMYKLFSVAVFPLSL